MVSDAGVNQDSVDRVAIHWHCDFPQDDTDGLPLMMDCREEKVESYPKENVCDA